MFRRPAALTRRTLACAWQDRVLGLAAEAGFWQLLSLPPLLLSILGTIGYLGDAVGAHAVDNVRQSLVEGSANLLTQSVVDEVVRPTIEEILFKGRPDVISIGFFLSLWTGSTAMATYVNTITIAYGQRELRSAIRSRILALGLFLLQVTSGVILLPALVLGPGLVSDLLDASHHEVVDSLITILYWPAVAVVSLAMLTTLYHLSLPVRRPWRNALPGAVLALVLWIVGSYLLRLYLEVVFGNALVYGTLAAPVAVLLFFYITALAVLLGAELNANTDSLGRDWDPTVRSTAAALDTPQAIATTVHTQLPAGPMVTTIERTPADEPPQTGNAPQTAGSPPPDGPQPDQPPGRAADAACVEATSHGGPGASRSTDLAGSPTPQ